MPFNIVWFKNDLRVYDHEALYQAARTNQKVIGLYCFEPFFYQKTQHSFNKTGAQRAKFIIESVETLRDNLGKCGIPLIIRYQSIVDVLKELQTKIQIAGIYTHFEVGSEEQKIIQNVKDTFSNISINTYFGHNIIHIDDLPYSLQSFPKVFSAFKKRMINQLSIRSLYQTPKKQVSIPSPIPSKIPTLIDLGYKKDDLRQQYYLKGGSIRGREHFHHYLENHIQHYEITRNQLEGMNYSSKLSAYLAHGCLSPRYVYQTLKQYEVEFGTSPSIISFLNELLWRDYFWFIHYQYQDKLFRSTGLFNIPIPWKEDFKMINAWINGETGFPLIDAAMNELRITGFMSNRNRQVVASFFAKNLLLNPIIGAEYFESCLVDYDVSSNYGNWLYVSGIGNDFKYFRVFNPERQRILYDPDEEYIKHYLAKVNQFNPIVDLTVTRKRFIDTFKEYRNMKD